MSAKKIYESAWQRNGLRFRATSEDMLVSKEANDTAADFIKRTIRAIGQDPKTAAILSDIDHPCAAERPPIDTDYFETYNRPNVSLSLITRFLQCRPGILSCQGRPSSTVTKAGCSTMLCLMPS